MPRFHLVALACATVFLFGCDDRAQTPETSASTNNSDPRKTNYQPGSHGASYEAKQSAIEAENGHQASVTAGRAASSWGRIAVLVPPGTSSSFRVFLNTEANDNADHVRSGSLWDGINGINGAGALVSDRLHPKWFANERWYKIGNSWSYFGSNLDQSSGIAGMRYSGATTPSGVRDSRGNLASAYPYYNTTRGILLTFLEKQMTQLPRLSFDYAVLRLGDACPENGYPFKQHFDDEDTDNQDWADIDLYPGWSSRLATGTTLAFCFVPKRDDGYLDYSALSSFGIDVGIFANPPYPRAWPLNQLNTLVVDAEDTDFAGQFDWEGLSPAFQQRVQDFMIISSAAQTPFLNVLTIPKLTTGVL